MMMAYKIKMKWWLVRCGSISSDDITSGLGILRDLSWLFHIIYQSIIIIFGWRWQMTRRSTFKQETQSNESKSQCRSLSYMTSIDVKSDLLIWCRLSEVSASLIARLSWSLSPSSLRCKSLNLDHLLDVLESDSDANIVFLSILL